MSLYTYMYISISIYICVCVCVCVWRRSRSGRIIYIFLLTCINMHPPLSNGCDYSIYLIIAFTYPNKHHLWWCQSYHCENKSKPSGAPCVTWPHNDYRPIKYHCTWAMYKELYIKLTCDNFSVGISYTEGYISVPDIPSNSHIILMCIIFVLYSPCHRHGYLAQPYERYFTGRAEVITEHDLQISSQQTPIICT